MASRRTLILLSVFSLGLPAFVTGQISPANISMGSLQQQQFTVSGYSQVTWTLVPAQGMGTINQNGLYTSPALSSSQSQVVFIFAQPAFGPFLTTSVNLQPGLAGPYVPTPVTPTPTPSSPTPAPTIGFAPLSITVSLSPGSVSLQAGQSTTFTATVQGTNNNLVQWSVNPSLGTINNGVYTAPSSITTDTQVTISATSEADSTQVATATVMLTPPVVPVSISVSPNSTTVAGGHSAQFTASVSGSTNTGVSWSVTPSTGSITNGVYSAPASVASQQIIMVTATSQADPTKTASASLTLKPVSNPVSPPQTVVVTMAPQTASLGPGQRVTITPKITGTSNTGLIWDVNPPMGIVGDGYYEAPATIVKQQVVSLKITSVVDSSATWTSTITLVPTVGAPPPPPVVGVTVGPSTASVGAGKSATFAATVTGTRNTTVTWSLIPAVGTIVNGVYTAPAIIASAQTITIKATSVASASAMGTANVSLTPSAVVVGVAVAPSTASVSAGKSATFAATVTGTSDTAVTWSLKPAVGTILNGVYTAPATIAGAQTITITATSLASGSAAGTASVTLTPSATSTTTSAPSTTVTLPVEVMGASGTTASVAVNVPSGANVSGPLALWMQIHGLKYDTEASVQVNNSAWLPLSTGNVTLLGNAAAFGGIGGGFHTLQLTLNLPAGAVVAGTNTITFRFNGTDGVVSGFRVLAFNIQSARTNLLPASLFVQDDPNTWQPPSAAASDIAAGLALYQGASLTTPSGPIRAHCSDCHAVDGRDLKYFNYSNNAIEARSVFHGLTAQQGAQIASYIRSLNLPNPGQPWNPPYQPGPGLDSQPVANWSAGAGLDAVLDNDSEMQPYLMPGGSTAGWSATSYLNARETPIVMQLPDWNSWLPVIHPMDAFGASFTTSDFNLDLPILRAALVPNSPTAYNWALFQLSAFTRWGEAASAFEVPIETNATSANWPGNLRTEVYSMAQWNLVKTWEVNQEFGLEGMPQVPFGAKADVRGWYGGLPFYVSPNMLHIPAGAGIGNGSEVVRDYLALSWYHMQLLLNDGQGTQSNHEPIDYGYVVGFVKDVFAVDSSVPAIMLETEWQIKALQEFTQTGTGPQAGNILGWDPVHTIPGAPVYSAWETLWSATSPATQTSMLQASLQAWFDQASKYTPQQYYQGGWASAADNPATLNYDETFGGEVWYILPRYRFFGVDANLVDQVTAWAATIWPKGNWALNNSATCTSELNCTSGY